MSESGEPYRFWKGHGTENDFVVLPDPDGAVHGDLAPARVAALCDRRAGIGADGVLRVIRSSAVAAGRSMAGQSEWFMDYRNANGSISEMCGNGIRVFARHLVDVGLAAAGERLDIGTRDGIKSVTVEDRPNGMVTVDMGVPELLGESVVGLGRWSWPARHVSTGNPHAVVFVDSLSELGDLAALTFDRTGYPAGVNVEFVERRGESHLAMRVHERGVGETRSCGTGACAAAVAAATEDGAGPGSAYDVEVPGGLLVVRWTESGRMLLLGPAMIVAEGTTDL
ncbi:MAG: diaminopimelate epimerase [Nocardioides sp.]